MKQRHDNWSLNELHVLWKGHDEGGKYLDIVSAQAAIWDFAE